IKQACSLIHLQVKNVLPETICYFKLFEKTLREEKKEIVWYIHYRETSAYGYLYDSLGLKESRRYEFFHEPQKFIKESADALASSGSKVNRLILSGTDSSKVRQDHFTKTVGVWTNPLEKIIYNFYEQYTRILTPSDGYALPILQYDVCLGAFIFDYERDHNGAIAATTMTSSDLTSKRSFKMPNLGISGRDITIFFFSLVVTSLAIIGYVRFSSGKFMLPSLPGKKDTVVIAPSKAPTPSPSPTPSVNRTEVTIKILNGEGTPGFATKVGTALKELGYTDTAGANADSFDYSKSELQINKAKRKTLESVFISDLKKFVDIDPKMVKDTPEDEKADVVLIVGKDFIVE
ncbi:MAG: LytR C-terminal domain-containing protein, partial [Candidatus Roizmanbacteria bacterium]